jgi:Flp pilus assembly protein TadB
VNEPIDPQMDSRKVRMGLAIVTVIVLVALVLVAVVDDPVGRAVMLAVAALGFVRAFLLTRSLRRDLRP